MDDAEQTVTLEEIAEANALLAGNQYIADTSDLRKYRIELPNLYDDAGMDVYEFRLLAHYKRVGTCTEGKRTTARKCKMSSGQVSEKRKSLAIRGFIKLEEVKSRDGVLAYKITIVDKWLENFQTYHPGSPHDHPRSPHDRGWSPHEPKKEPFKKIEQPPKITADLDPAIALFRQVTGKFPNKAVFKDVTEALSGLTLEMVEPYFREWISRGYNPISIKWATEWAKSQSIPSNGQKKPRVVSQSDRNSPEAIAAMRQFVIEDQARINREQKAALSRQERTPGREENA